MFQSAASGHLSISGTANYWSARIYQRWNGRKTMKFIVVSYSMPIKILRSENGLSYIKMCGGLVNGIESLSNHFKFMWIGSLGFTEVAEDEIDKVTVRCWDQFRCVPVFIPKSLWEGFLRDFCDKLLWPILHSFPDNACFTYTGYEAYKEANRIFAEKVLEKADDGDIIWIHDYQLMLLPAILKARNKTLRVMFFLHIPFPDPSNMEKLLCRDEILKGICACDVVAFHTPEYVYNFKKATRHIPTNVIVKAIPVGIDPDRFRREMEKPETQKRIRELREQFKGKKILLGVDRTDYIKGIPNKIKGFERFLQRNPEMKNNVILIQIGVPNRLDVKETASYIAKIGELASEVNGKTNDVANTSLHLLIKSVPFSELTALYAVSNVVLVTSIIDGLNLIALEYISTQSENDPGVVVLSKFAGIISTLQGAIKHNPNNTEDIAEAIEQALSLPLEERRARHKKNVRNVEIFTSMKWAKDNLDKVCPGWESKLK